MACSIKDESPTTATFFNVASIDYVLFNVEFLEAGRLLLVRFF